MNKLLSLSVFLIIFATKGLCQSVHDLPRSVHELQKIEDTSSIEFEIKSYQAAVDLKNLARNYHKSGQSEEALKYANLAAHLFPYRGDLVDLKRRLLRYFVRVTNDYLEPEKVDCGIVLERVEFLENISPDAVRAIEYKKECVSSKDISESDYSDSISIGKYIDIKVPSRPKTGGAVSEDLYDEYNDLLKQRYFEGYPYRQQLLLGLQYLGNFALYSTEFKINKTKTDKNKIGLTANYDVHWISEQPSYEKFCKQLVAEFKILPKRGNTGPFRCQEKRLIHNLSKAPLFEHRTPRPNNYFDYNGSHSMFNPLPNYLVFKVSFLGENEMALKETRKIFVTNHGDPGHWLMFSGLTDANFDPYDLSRHMSFLRSKNREFQFNRFDQLEVSLEDKKMLKKLRSIKVEFLPQVTYQTYLRLIDKLGKSNVKNLNILREFNKNVSTN